MKRKIPVDFEQKVKEPAKIGNNAYPYRISAKDLMDNFNHCNLEIDQTAASGLYIEETLRADGSRKIVLKGTVPSAESANGHPWKASKNDDGTVAIASGRVKEILVKGTSLDVTTKEVYWPFVQTYREFTGSNVATSGAGYIYGKVAITERTMAIDGQASINSYYEELNNLSASANPEAYFSSDSPATLSPSDSKFHFLICEVGSDSTITKQVQFDDVVIPLSTIELKSFI